VVSVQPPQVQEEPVVKRIVALSLVVAALAAIAVPAVSARSETTAPGYNYKIRVTISKGGQVVMTSMYSKRGWLLHFIVTNKDRKAHRFDVGGRGPAKAIKPGKIAKFGAYSDQRGQFPFHVDGHVRGYFNVV
jgi:hypothetical protein